MPAQIFSHSANSDLVLSVLTSHLPNSLPLLRRIQYMDLPGGRTSTSHVLASFPPNGPTPNENEPFTIAYLDLTCGPETEMWIYCSLEHSSHTSHNSGEGEAQIVALISHTSTLAEDFETTTGKKRGTPGIVLIGTVAEKVLRILEEKRMVQRATVPHFKFVFRRETLPAQKELPEDMEWGVVKEAEFGLVLSRQEIPRKPETMKVLPSAAVRLRKSGEPVAWGFIGLDGSLRTLHCEEAYRGRGLAKAVATKLLQMTILGDDGLGHADVLNGNLASQGVCKSLGGMAEWMDYWVWVGFDAPVASGSTAS